MISADLTAAVITRVNLLVPSNLSAGRNVEPCRDTTNSRYTHPGPHSSAMANTTRDRLRGTLELLILRTLTWGPRHGYAIARWLEETTGAALRVEEGSLYPALYRMEQRGWIESDWRRSELDRAAKFYRLTAAGRRQLKKETSEWRAFVAAVAIVLEPSR